jgi:hypothetical protein
MSVFDWSTTASNNGNSDSNINFSENQAPSTLNDSARALMARIAHWVNFFGATTTQGGSSNAYTLTSGEGLSAYVDGMRFAFQPNADSTGAATLNLDGIGAKKLFMPDGAQVGSGDLDADSIYDVIYDSALDSSSGGFKLMGFPDTTLTSGDYLQVSNNLSDVDTASAAASNIGALQIANDLSDVNSASAAASNIAALQISNNLSDVGSTSAAASNIAALQISNNLSDLDTASTARDNLGLGSIATQDDTALTARVAAGNATTGTLTSADANNDLGDLTGDITIPNGVFSARDIVIGSAGGSSRTITRGASLTMYVNGSDSASATLTARGQFSIRFISSSACYLAGDVS